MGNRIGIFRRLGVSAFIVAGFGLAVGSANGAWAQDTARTDLLDAPSTQASALAPVSRPVGQTADAKPRQPEEPAVSQEIPSTPEPRQIRQQQGRIFGVVPNFATVSGGTAAKPAGWKTDWGTANRQALDYSSFAYLFLSSGTAWAEDSHPSLDTYHGGNAPFWGYLWRGFLDKTDGTYQGAFLFPALLHEDTRYYAMGEGRIWKRTLHATGSVVIARTYSGRSIPNVAGIAGKVGTQAVSTVYYPPGSEGFAELAEKFTYSCLRQAGISVLREFSPDLNALVHHHRHSAGT